MQAGCGNTSKTVGVIKGLGVKGWQPQMPNGGGNTPKNHWFYKGLGVQGWQPQMPKGSGNIPKTIGFIMVWVPRVGNSRCQRAAETHQHPLVL